MPTFKLHRGSLQERFLKSRAKIQIYGGGFANGKTATSCIKAIELAKDYPGSNGLMARSTYPKLNDTLRKEFLKWCPVDWIDSLGTWPQTYTELMYDVLCINLSTGTGSVIDDGIKEIEYIFEPVEYYNLAGQKVIPNSTGIYIASDGYIRKLVYLTK